MDIDLALTEQPLSPSEQELLALIYSRLDLWSAQCRPYHDAARAARQTMLLRDPGQDEGQRLKRPTLQLQTLKSTINNCVADQMDNLPEALLLPEQPAAQQVADDMTDVVRFVLARNAYEQLHRQRVEDYFITGTSILQVSWDETMDHGGGDIAVSRWPVEALVWDPAAADIQEARAVMKVSWHQLSWYREHYPDRARFVSGENGQHSDVGLPSVQESLSQDEERAMLVEYWYRSFDAKTRRYRINVAYAAGGALLDRAENVYAHGLYPFEVDAFTPIEGLPVGMGLVQELTPMMRYVNRYARYIDENLRMSAKIRMLVQRGAKIDAEALANWEQNVITGENIGEDAVRWLQSKPLSGMAVQQMLQFQTDIKQDSGQNQFTRGETAGGVTAAQAISALQEAGGKITRLHTQNLNQGFKRVVEMILWLIGQFYGDRRERLITGTDGRSHRVLMSADHLMGNEPVLPPEEELAQLPEALRARILHTAQRKAARRRREMTEPPYTVSVQVQRRNPLRIQAQNELFIQAYTMAAQAGQQFPLSMLFDLLVVDGKERILPVVRQVDQQTAMLQQMTEQVGQLQQENDGLKRSLAAYGSQIRSYEPQMDEAALAGEQDKG